MGDTPDPRVEQFLTDATAGLADDPELQRDIRAELAAHIDDKLDALRAEGVGEDRIIDEVLRAMGDVLETASTLSEANHQRMSLRGQLRTWLRFALVPVAVITAVVTWMGMTNRTIPTLLPLFDISNFGGEADTLLKRSWYQRPYTPEQELILKGDRSRSGHAQQQRAIWERFPDNKVYLGNYLSVALSEYGSNKEELGPVLLEALKEAGELEPDNARYDLLRAALLAEASSTYDGGTSPEAALEDGVDPVPTTLEINDRETLELAMALLRSGLAKPGMRRYAMEMMQERRAIMGPQERCVDWLRQTAVAASILLPDMQYLRNLSRVSIPYGELLLQEGKEEQAAAFLQSWEPLAHLIAKDGFTLIDVLVAGAIVKGEGEEAARVYERAGRSEAAARMRARSEALYQGMAAWRAQREAGGEGAEQGELEMRERGGVLASLLIPALGKWPDLPEYEAGRMLEYTVVTEAVVGAVLVFFLLALIGCCVVALRWRYSGARAGAIPILLIPQPAQLAKVILLGVLLPVVMFLLVTRLVPWSGHQYSFTFAGHRLVAELALLVTVVSVVPVGMTVRTVAARCRALRIPVCPLAFPGIRLGVMIGASVLIMLWLVPPSLDSAVHIVGLWVAGVLMVFLSSAALATGIQGLAGREDYGLYYGTLFRSLIPVLSVVMVVLSLSTGPLLVWSEKAYLAGDTVMFDPSGGFTRLETEVTQALREDLLARFEGN